MAYETLRPPAEPLVMFHGTSSAHLASILSSGLQAAPAVKFSQLVGEAGAPHLIAFDGTYLSLDPDRVAHYATKAAEAFGGDPIVVTALVVPDDAHPDEDEMLWVLKCRFDVTAEERDRQPGFSGLFRDPSFRESFAEQLVADIENAFKPDRIDRSAMAENLVTLLEGVALLPPEWEGVTGDKGWLVQPWALLMSRTPEGMALYRDAIDGVCRSVLGPRPTSETCDLDGYKLRVPGGVPLEGRTFIAAVGSMENPRDILDRIDEVDLDGNPFAARFLGMGGLAPR